MGIFTFRKHFFAEGLEAEWRRKKEIASCGKDKAPLSSNENARITTQKDIGQQLFVVWRGRDLLSGASVEAGRPGDWVVSYLSKKVKRGGRKQKRF